MTKKGILCLIGVFLSIYFTTKGTLSQPSSKEKDPEIRLGEVAFSIRQFESTPHPLNLLEIYVDVLNQSRGWTAPPHSIKLVIIAKEIKFREGTLLTDYTLPIEESILNFPLPPKSNRTLIFGFSLPEEKPESITFEIQINPPHGEKKVVKWEGKRY